MARPAALLAALFLAALAPMALAQSAQELIERATFKGHTFRADRTALSPDGTILASGGGDTRGGELKLWNALTGKEISSLAGYSNTLNALVFNPDGKLLASAGLNPVQLWDIKTHREIPLGEIPPGRRRSHEWISTLAFSTDGKKLAAASWTEARVWEIDTGKQVASFRRRTSAYGRMAFSPDLSTLAVPDHQEIDLWDVTTGKVRATLSEHRGDIGFLAYTPDGKTLIAASTWYRGRNFKWHGDLKFWDLSTGKERIAFKGPWGRISDAVLSPDGKTLALLDFPDLHTEPDLKLVDVATGRHKTIPSPLSYLFTSLAFTADGRLFVTGTPDEKTLKLWQVSLQVK
jgi:WD40 repeat protein